MQTLTRERAINLLKDNPYLYAHAVGFTKLQRLHNEWIKDMVFGEGDRTLQAHRGSYKTTCDSVAFAIIIILYPNDKTVFMRKTDTDIKEIIKQTKMILKHEITNELIKAIWGCKLRFIVSSASEISTNLTNDARGTSQLVGMGSKGSMTGKHFDRVFTDDIVNVDDRTSKAERERTKIVYQELQNIKNRGGRIFNTGTPWHKDDCFSIMPEPIKYDYKATRLISDEEIKKIKESMLASLFAANYELRHIASEDVIFVEPRQNEDPVMVMNAKHCHVDAAYGGEDFTAFTICRKVNGVYYVFGKLWHKHVDDCIDDIIKYRKRFNAGKIYNEKNADKGYLDRDLRRRGERTVPYNESQNKFMKITSWLRGEWSEVVFVKGTDKAYIEQITDFNENADHDDAPDSLASLVRLLWKRENGDIEYTPIIGK